MTKTKNPGSNEGALGAGPAFSKTPQPDDPFEMGAEMVEGDPTVMLTCLIEEYARMGWDAGRIARIFDNPFFLASHGLAKRFGRGAIHAFIEHTVRRCGVYRFQVVEQNPIQPALSSALPRSEKGNRPDFARRS
jgi:hypothetical protein